MNIPKARYIELNLVGALNMNVVGRLNINLVGTLNRNIGTYRLYKSIEHMNIYIVCELDIQIRNRPNE